MNIKKLAEWMGLPIYEYSPRLNGFKHPCLVEHNGEYFISSKDDRAEITWNPLEDYNHTFMLLDRVEEKYPKLEWSVGYNVTSIHEWTYYCNILPVANEGRGSWVGGVDSTKSLAICKAVFDLIETHNDGSYAHLFETPKPSIEKLIDD